MTASTTTMRPRALRPGDTLAIVAPSGAVDPAQLQRGIALFEGAGFRARIDPELYARRGYLAGSSDVAAAAALSAAFTDPTIRAVVCAKGALLYTSFQGSWDDPLWRIGNEAVEQGCA